MLKQDLILQANNQKDLKEKIQKVIGLTKDKLHGKIMAKFAALRPKK